MERQKACPVVPCERPPLSEAGGWDGTQSGTSLALVPVPSLPRPSGLPGDRGSGGDLSCDLGATADPRITGYRAR